jgi:hypothetical protein
MFTSARRGGESQEQERLTQIGRALREWGNRVVRGLFEGSPIRSRARSRMLPSVLAFARSTRARYGTATGSFTYDKASIA